MSFPQVELNTNKGRIVLELNAEKAPKTVANFLEYVRDGFYDGVIFHRVIDGFMIQGGGMDDQVQGMIGDSQPVAVSPGEFIVPADVVSGIGDGDTNAGVQELEGMMDRVRQERTGTTKQPAPLGAMAGGALPA